MGQCDFCSNNSIYKVIGYFADDFSGGLQWCTYPWVICAICLAQLENTYGEVEVELIEEKV